jgi:hypothetical protein
MELDGGALENRSSAGSRMQADHCQTRATSRKGPLEQVGFVSDAALDSEHDRRVARRVAGATRWPHA